MQTVVPLPSGSGYCTEPSYASRPQLRPFYFLEVVAQRARGHWSPGAILHNPAVWTTALNVVMLVPLGVFLRYAHRLRFLPTVLLGFGVSLFFELTQLTGLWFVYPCPYRLFSGRILPELDPERDHHRRAMLLRVRRTSGRRAGPLSLLVRNGILFSPLWLLWLLLNLDRWDLRAHPAQLLIPAGLLVSVFVVVIWTPLAVLLDDEHRAPYERLTRTVNTAIVTPEPARLSSVDSQNAGTPS